MAMPKMDAVVLITIVSYIGRKRPAQALSMACKDLHAGIGRHVVTEHAPACVIQRFWRWCKLFSMSKSLIRGFERTGLTSTEFVQGMG